MRTFTYVEDYIELINGDRDPITGKIYGLFDSTPPIVSLARYDVQIVSSMSEAVINGRSLTDRQAELACKIILKYRKQLAARLIDVEPVAEPKFRLGIRTIDRRRILSIKNDTIVLQFPYDVKLIDDVRELAKISEGRWAFNGDSKTWQLGITETNVIAANGFALNHQFEIDEKFNELVQSITACEAIKYEIKLTNTPNGLTISNAAASLIEYINNWCGFHYSNINLLVDAAPVLGYTIDQTIEQELVSKYSPRVYNLMTAQETKFNPIVKDEIVKDIIDYANITGRYPIYVYEPNLSGHLLNIFVNSNFHSDEILQTTNLKKESPIAHKKVIYFNKFSSSWTQPIPLLISGQGMMHGGDKSLLLQRAEKVVYFAAEVYNNKTMQRRA